MTCVHNYNIAFMQVATFTLTFNPLQNTPFLHDNITKDGIFGNDTVFYLQQQQHFITVLLCIKGSHIVPLSITYESKMLFTKYTLLIYAVHLNLSV